MYVDSVSKVLLTCVVTLALTACGGGGGGGGGSLIGDGTGGSSSGGTSSGGSSSTGTITLSISGMVDANGEPDNVLAGNETATLTAEVTENGSAAELVVLFDATIGQLVQSSAQSTGGTAQVQIRGTGEAGASTVTASTTLSDGTEISTTLIVQTSASAPTIAILDASNNPVDTVELRAADSAALKARLTDWDGSPLSGIGVSFEFTFSDETSLTSNVSSGVTNASGDVNVTLTGTQLAGTGEFAARATFSGFELEDTITANGLGVDEEANTITMVTIDAGSDSVLAGNEKTSVVVKVLEDGVAKNGIVVSFSTNGTGGNLVKTSATTANNGTEDGIASVQLIGDGTAGTAEITASATLSNGIAVETTQIVQTSADSPSLTLVARSASGAVVTSFGGNQDLTLEATVVDFDGGPLDAGDAGVNVAFVVGSLGTAVNASNVTEFAVCPVNGVKANSDCAWIEFTSNATAGVGTFTATATINGIELSDSIQVTNTGQNSGSPDQDSFTISRITDQGGVVATTDYMALEGDIFNGETATIRVDLADYFNNPVPDGTLVEFRTELGDITDSCPTLSGSCEVTFTTSDPRAPIDSETSFRNLNDDSCPSQLIIDEAVTIAGGKAELDYRVKNIKRVVSAGTPTIVFGTSTYNKRSYGLECVSAPCSSGTAILVTYERLWLDELADGSSAHVLANPGEATEPFLDVTGTPCLAGSRSNLEQITGSINPASSATVTGVGTRFLEELAVGDRIKVSGEVRTVTAIASNTSLTVDAAFSDNLNDLSPERMAAPAYLGGMGQPYGALSTILAYAIGEESFVDENGNDEYDYGEIFYDLPEVFLDKNGDGVFGDRNADSATAGSVGPYIDTGTGTNPVGGRRDKSSPYCYGPRTIAGDPTGAGASTEGETYCYQVGGKEEVLIDKNGNGQMDVGNGIYNGSRCLTPLQDADNDGNADDVVCTTDLVHISREVDILMSGTIAYINFRTRSGGSNGGGELITSVQLAGGTTIDDTSGEPTDWTPNNGTAVVDQSIQKGVEVNTGLLAAPNRDVELFTIVDAFPTASANWTVTFDVTRTDANTGPVELFASGLPVAVKDTGGGVCGDVTESCTTAIDAPAGFTVATAGDLIVASADNTDPLGAELNNFSITGTTSGLGFDYVIVNGETVDSNDNTNLGLTQFDVGDTINATTVFGGVSERVGNGGNVPTLSTSLTSLAVYFTDKYNMPLPDGSTITISSNNFTNSGCTLTSVNGVAVNANAPGATGGSHSSTLTLGSDTATGTVITLAAGSGSGPVIASVTTPSGTTSSRSITCSL